MFQLCAASLMIPSAILHTWFGSGSQLVNQRTSSPCFLCGGLDVGGSSSTQPRPRFLNGLPGTGLCSPTCFLNACLHVWTQSPLCLSEPVINSLIQLVLCLSHAGYFLICQFLFCFSQTSRNVLLSLYFGLLQSPQGIILVFFLRNTKGTFCVCSSSCTSLFE